MVKLVDLENKWALAIGKILIEFGSIENTTYCILKGFLSEHVENNAENNKLATRISIIINALKTASINEDELNESEKRELILLFENIDKYRRLRNNLAHEPLVLKFYDEHAEGTILEELIVSKKRNMEKCHDLDELQLAAIELENLASGIHIWMANVRSKFIDQGLTNSNLKFVKKYSCS